MTAEKTPAREPETTKYSVGLDSGDSIAGAGRLEAAARPEEWRECPLIDTDRHGEREAPQARSAHACHAPACSAAWRSCTPSSHESSLAASERPITTRSRSLRRPARSRRNHSRIRRFRRLRTTAFPTRRLTVTPRRGEHPAVPGWSAAAGAATTTKPRTAPRRPCRRTCWNSRERSKRSTRRKTPVRALMATSRVSSLLAASVPWPGAASG